MQVNNATMTADQAPPAPQFSGPNTSHFDQSKPFGNYSWSHSEANTARFRCKAAKVGRDKKPEALIDSGATHNFCHDRHLFKNYKTMEHEEVEGPAGKSSVIRFGDIEIELLGGKRVKAYHVPDFTTHILVVSSLTNFVDVLFSKSLKRFKGCFKFEPGTRNIIYETPVKDDLYRMKLNSF